MKTVGWRGSACLVVALLCGCATRSGLVDEAWDEQKAYIVTHRALGGAGSALVAEQAWAKVVKRAEKYRGTLIKVKLGELRRRYKQDPGRAPVLAGLLSEIDEGLTFTISDAGLSQQLSSILPDPAARDVVSMWAGENLPVRIDEWATDDRVVRFRDGVADALHDMTKAIDDALAASDALLRAGTPLAALDVLGNVVRFDPSHRGLQDRFGDVLAAGMMTMTTQTDADDWWGFYTVHRLWMEQGQALQALPGAAAWGESLLSVYRNAFVSEFERGIEFFLDLADKVSAIESRPGLGMMICVLGTEFLSYAGETGGDRLADDVDEYRQIVDEARGRYRQATERALGRPISVVRFDVPAATGPVDALAAMIGEELETLMADGGACCWGLSVVDVTDPPSGGSYGYRMQDGVAERLAVAGPKVVREDTVNATSVYAPEAQGEGQRQMIVSHRVRRRTMQQTAVIAGHVSIAFGGTVRAVTFEEQETYDYVVEDEVHDARAVRYETVKRAKPVYRLALKSGQPEDDAVLLRAAQARAARTLAQALFEQTAAFPDYLKVQAAEAESRTEPDVAAEAWCRLEVYLDNVARRETSRRRKGLAAGAGKAGARARSTTIVWLQSRRER
jgi:hypothetical protein